MWRRIKEWLAVAAFIMRLGTVGGMEQGTIAAGRGTLVALLYIAAALILVFSAEAHCDD